MPKLYRSGRKRAFEALFEAEFGRAAAPDALDRRQREEPLSPTEQRYAAHLVSGVLERRRDLDACIQEHARPGPSPQMAPLERTLLRIALYELLFNNAAVPSAAVINEAVELAKTYGADAARRLVNGVLGTVSRRIRRPPRLRARNARPPETPRARNARPPEIPRPRPQRPRLTEEKRRIRVALFERVRDIIEEQLGVDRDAITMKASFIDDLGADSSIWSN